MTPADVASRPLGAYASGIARLPVNVEAKEESNHVARCDRLVTELAGNNAALLARRTATSLIFGGELMDALSAGLEAVDVASRRRAFCTAYFYCCIEMEAPDARTFHQSHKLGHAFLDVAREFRRCGMYEHGKAAAARAEELFRELALSREADEATYLRRAMETQTGGRTLSNLGSHIAWGLAGFGFRPYWLLAWSVVLIVVVALVLGISDVGNADEVLRLSCMAYVGGVGVGDLKSLRGFGQIVLILEALAALVLNTVLLALLARRWFRF